MRVGVIGPPQDDEFAANIADCLPDVGAEPVALGSARRELREPRLRALSYALAGSLPQIDLRLQRATAERALAAELDVVISVEGLLLPETVKQLQAGGAKVALWFPDHVANLGGLRMLAAGYDRLYFKDSILVERLRDTYGLPTAYLPEACNPHWHRPIGEPGSTGDVVIAGNLYVTRAYLLNRLAADEVPLTLYGAGWPRVVPEGPATALPVSPPVHREEKSRVFRQAAAVLNNLHPTEMTSVNCRLFEATATGAAVLCEDRPALRELFDVGTEVLAFSNYEQLLSHARRLVEDPELTRKVGDAASARAHAEHTYQHRLRQMLSDLA